MGSPTLNIIVPSLVLLILFLVLSFLITISSESNKEADALLKWKASLQSHNLSLLPSWTNATTNVSSKISPCAWYGINCNDAGRVTNITLRNTGLSGTLRDFSFSSFPQLVHLDLSLNGFFGTIPSQIGNLTKLNYISLESNQMSGKIPLEVGLLTHLKLYGSLPPFVGNFTNLRVFHVYDNSLYGSIPREIWNLKSLVYLDLNINQFRGFLPPFVGNLTNLERVGLMDNHLSGSIPPSLGNSTLTWLTFSLNHFTCYLPHDICRGGALEIFTLEKLHSLIRVRLDGNNLTGNISEALGIYPNLTFIDISRNNFYGEISSNWGKCPKLGTLNVSMNNITGGIPREIGNSSQLQALDLSLNHIVGDIPKELGKESNQLTGRLPTEIGSLIKLEYLDFSANRFNNSVPEILDNLLKLHYLGLSNNQSLDRAFQQQPVLKRPQFFSISNNSLPAMSVIDISDNQLQGPVPNSTAFRNAPAEVLEGNKGLCGGVKGMQPCKVYSSHKKNSGAKWFAIVFPVLGALFVSMALIAIFILKKRKSDSGDPQSSSQNPQGLFSILNFEGKLVYDEIVRATNDFDAEYCIGNGGHGSVYRAELPSGTVVAVKKFQSPLPCDQIAYQKEFLTEVQALTEIRHRNIVKLYGFCSHARHSFLVYEFLERGSLAAILSNDAAAQELGWSQRMNVIKGVADALSYLHHDCFPPIVHRDISSKNLLLDLEYEAHVADFGIAKFLKPDSSNWTEFAGTYGYIAPALDEMLDPRLPTPSRIFQEKLISIMEVAFSCLNESPESRPTMKIVSQQLTSAA
ncbi:hypothetical protein CUMW_236620 [Citrus unshiu]|nr:hypothetical protein CUMW_236620 [Citrus unshiu]